MKFTVCLWEIKCVFEWLLAVLYDLPSLLNHAVPLCQVWSRAVRLWRTPSVSSSVECCRIRSAPAGSSPLASSSLGPSTCCSLSPPPSRRSPCSGLWTASGRDSAGHRAEKCCARWGVYSAHALNCQILDKVLFHSSCFKTFWRN